MFAVSILFYEQEHKSSNNDEAAVYYNKEDEIHIIFWLRQKAKYCPERLDFIIWKTIPNNLTLFKVFELLYISHNHK